MYDNHSKENNTGKKLKRVVVKEELVALTKDFTKAVILNQMIYWSERVADFDEFILQEKNRAKNSGVDINIHETNGWIYKTAEELSEETMLGLSPSAMREQLKKLVAAGYLSERRNPEHRWDRTIQYRVNLINIQRDLLSLGYSLEGYRVNLNLLKELFDSNKLAFSETENAFSHTENANSETENAICETENAFSDTEMPFSETENAFSKNEIGISGTEDRILNLENRTSANRKAIPEITTEITNKDYIQSIYPSVSNTKIVPVHKNQGTVKTDGLMDGEELVNHISEETGATHAQVRKAIQKVMDLEKSGKIQITSSFVNYVRTTVNTIMQDDKLKAQASKSEQKKKTLMRSMYS